MNRETKRVLIQVGLFIATFATTTLAGAEWTYGKRIWSTEPFTWADFASGMQFSIPLILILTVHEFGHYFVALYHKVKTSLPYYIPIPPIPFLPFSLGTIGAVIRLRSRPETNIKNFDIGLAGPLAGFVVALMILFYGFMTLPEPEYIFQFHPEYKAYGLNYADHVYSKEYVDAHTPEGAVLFDVKIGSNLIFWMMSKIANTSRLPNEHELMHYPVLLAGYFALFVTCLNLLPIGQLDGGHVVYGLFGFKIHRVIATISFVLLIFYAGLGIDYIDPRLAQETSHILGLPVNSLVLGVAGYLLFLYLAFKGLRKSPTETLMYALLMFALQFSLGAFVKGIEGYEGWLLFGLILGRFVGIEHPTSEIEQPLDSKRVVLGWLTLLIFILCFSPTPIQLDVFIDE
jgi:membrane-associated protease RseP (regulator of RpoE activity)